MFEKLKAYFTRKPIVKPDRKPTFYISVEAFNKMDTRQKLLLLERYEVKTPTFIKEDNV